MMRVPVCSFLMLFGLAGIAFAQPIYLGKEEFDTADRNAMAALIEHCTQLASVEQTDIETSGPRAQDMTDPPDADEAQGASTPSAQPGTQGEAKNDPATLSIDIDGLASVSEEQVPAGEGANAAAPPGETSGAEAKPDVSSITLQSCREAGLIY
jgi:hypothetical protein